MSEAAAAGQEWTNTEYGHLLAAAGLSLANVQPVAAPYGVIEGYPARAEHGKPARDNTQADQFCAHRRRRGHIALAAPDGGSGSFKYRWPTTECDSDL